MLATLYQPDAEAERQAQRANRPAVRMFTETLHRDPPGPATDNRIEQSYHFTGVIYTAICARMTGLAGSTARVMKRNSQPKVQSKKARRIERELARRLGIRKSGSPGPTPGMNANDYVEAKPSDPFVRLFEHVNENDTFPDFMSQWVMQYDLTGTGFLWCRPSMLGYEAPPAEFYILPTALMGAFIPAFLEGGSYPYGAWRVLPYYPSGLYGMLPSTLVASGAVLDGREVKRHRRPHPLYRWDGYSPLTAGGVQFDVLESIDQSRKAAMDHGFRPDAIATIKGATPETLNTLSAAFEQSQGGARNAHRILFGNGDNLDVETLNTAPREMDYGAGWDQMVKVCLAILGVPPAVAGLVEASSYSQLFASLKQFYTLNLNPLARSIGAFLTKNVVAPHDKNTIVQIDLPEIDDREMDMKKMDLLAKYGVITDNELRGWAGEEPLPDGEKRVGKGGAMPGQGPSEGDGGGVVQPGGDANAALAGLLGQSGAGGGPPQPGNSSGAGSLPGRAIVKSRLRELVSSLG